MTPLAAPFPWYGGKSRWAEDVWRRFGKADVYVEPFAGSLAVLLANPEPARREIVCDTNGHICNLWRSLQADPEATAYWADYPTIHQDLTARHKWLRQWGDENGPRLSEDCATTTTRRLRAGGCGGSPCGSARGGVPTGRRPRTGASWTGGRMSATRKVRGAWRRSAWSRINDRTSTRKMAADRAFLPND